MKLILGLCLLFGCDRSEERAAEKEALQRQPPAETGNIGQAMRAERAMPRLSTPSERLLLAIRDGNRVRAEHQIAQGATLDPDTPWLGAAFRKSPAFSWRAAQRLQALINSEGRLFTSPCSAEATRSWASCWTLRPT